MKEAKKLETAYQDVSFPKLCHIDLWITSIVMDCYWIAL